MAKVTTIYEFGVEDIKEALMSHFHLSTSEAVSTLELPILYSNSGDGDGSRGPPYCTGAKITVKEK